MHVLPTYPVPTKVAAAGLPSETAGGPKRRALARLRILAVDDNEDAVVFLAKLLEHHGHDARSCTSGAGRSGVGCRVRTRCGHPCPRHAGLNGLETAERLRNEPWGEKKRSSWLR